MDAATLVSHDYRKYNQKIGFSDCLYQKRFGGTMPDGDPYSLTWYEYDFSTVPGFAGTNKIQYKASMQLRNETSCFDLEFHVRDETVEDVEAFFAKSIEFYRTLGF